MPSRKCSSGGSPVLLSSPVVSSPVSPVVDPVVDPVVGSGVVVVIVGVRST
jgi:hypothetical protein